MLDSEPRKNIGEQDWAKLPAWVAYVLLAVVLFGSLVLVTIAFGSEASATWSQKWQEFVSGEADGFRAIWHFISGLWR